MTDPRRRTKKVFFALLLVALFGAFLAVDEAIRAKAARDHRDLVTQNLDRLSNATLSLLKDFSPDTWIRSKGAAFLASARKQLTLQGFSPAMAGKLGKELARLFPGATVFSFDATGKLVFQTGNESKRSREIFWEGVLAFQRELGGDQQDKRFQIADRFCKGLYGSLTTLSDLISAQGLPQHFLEKGQNRFSWVLPQEFLASPEPVSPGTGTGGIWLLIDPKVLPTRSIAERALKHFPEAADVVMIIKKTGGKPRQEMKRGRGRMLVSTAARFFQGKTEWEDRLGCWAGRYIPGQSGRWLIAGVRAQHLEGFFGIWGKALRIFSFFLALAASWLAYRSLFTGVHLGLNLKPQVFILFAAVAVFPFAAVVFQGFDLARDNAHRSRNTWEQRIKGVLEGIDRGATVYREEQARKLATIEKAFSALLPLSKQSTADLKRLCDGLDNFEVLVLDKHGEKLNLSRNQEKIQRGGEYPSYMARYLAGLVETEGGVPDPALANSPTMLSGHALEILLTLLFRHQEVFDRLRIRDTTYLQKKAILSQPGTQPAVTLGLISWLFDEAEFMRPYVETHLTRVPGKADRNDSIKIGFAAPGGKIFPQEWAASQKLKVMVDRVEKFQFSETAIVPLNNGKSYLTTVLCPVRMRGLLLIGMIEARETPSRGFDVDDIAGILGLRTVLPLDKDRISALQILFLSAFLSLLLMVPMAVVLSRWIVGRILDLHAMVDAITRNHFEARAVVSADDELGELALAFNEMAKGLQERERMSRFVSDQVLEEVKKNDAESLALGGVKRDVAILFTHIFHFNDLLDRHPPERIIERLNEYFTVMNVPVMNHRGSIDKMIGDAIMAVFFHVPGLEHPALRAVRAAKDMLQAATQLEESRKEKDGMLFRTDIGIQYGQAISGKIGSKHGMIDFTVIGDAVNTAARIQSTAARQHVPSILFSDDVRKHLPPDMETTRIEQVALKGKSQSLELYKFT